MCHFAVVGVRELKSVVPLALPVEETRHALQHIVVHLAEDGLLRVGRAPALRADL